MRDVAIRRAVDGDRRTAVAVSARGFCPDPLFDFFARDLLHEHRLLPAFFRPTIDDVLSAGRCWVGEVNGEVRGVAGWLPPSALPRSPRREAAITGRSVLAIVRARHALKGMRLFASMVEQHPKDPHWYLQLLVVDPTEQGRGLGGRLIQPGLDAADAEGLPAYLETQKESNVAWYGRHGFELTREIRLAGTPPLWCLTRQPR